MNIVPTNAANTTNTEHTTPPLEPAIDVSKLTVEETRSLEQEVAIKILHILQVFPAISPSMLQIGIGSSLPAKLWRPILQQMIDDKTVKQDFCLFPTPSGRQTTYTIISLYNTEIKMPKASGQVVPSA